MKAVIFGANGQDGYYLMMLLENLGIKCIGVSQSGNFSPLNLSNYRVIEEFISNERPDYVFHLAAISKTTHSFLTDNFNTITIGTQNILEAVKNKSPNTRVFITGSGLQFENKNLPIKEDDPFVVKDPYSLCRIQSIYTARYYKGIGLSVYIGNFFNHDSPKRSENHLCQKIIMAAYRIRNGSKEKIEIGDLYSMKEYGYADEVMHATWEFINQSEVFELNIGTGKAYSIKDWLELCFNHYNLNYEDHILENKDYISPYKILVSDNSLLTKKLGFKFKTDIQDLFELMKM